MAYLSLYRKHRPQTFAEVLGQEHISTTLANAVVEDRVAHAYLFTGPRGTGKTSTARILAKALNCERGPTPTPCGECESCRSITDGSSLDVIEIDAASHSKVDETREVLAGVSLATAGGRMKIYVIDEVHMLSAGSFNALLKTLEEPPEHVLFILATTEAHKVLPTIISRTQRFDFRPIAAGVLEDHLRAVAKVEDIEIDDDALGVVARHARGGARDALSALDQLSSYGERITADSAERVLGRRDEDAFRILFAAIAAGDSGGVFTAIDSLISKGSDARQLALGALVHARSLLLLRTAPDAEDLLDVAEGDRAALIAQADTFSAASLLRVVDLVGSALTEMRTAPNHRLLLEVALVRAAAPATDPGAAGLLERVNRLELQIAGSPSAGEAGPAHPSVPAQLPDVRVGEPGPARPPEKVTPVAATKKSPARTDHAAEASAPAETSPVAPEAPADVGLSHIKDAWPAAIREVNKRSKRVGAFLHSSRPLRYDDGVLVVEAQSDFHASEMKSPKNREMLSGALHDTLGVRPQLAFATRGADAGAAATEAREEVSYDETSVPAAEHDPIELVKKGLGAEVVEEIGEE